MQHRLFSDENVVGWKSSACGPPTVSLCRTNTAVKQASLSPSAPQASATKSRRAALQNF